MKEGKSKSVATAVSSSSPMALVSITLDATQAGSLNEVPDPQAWPQLSQNPNKLASAVTSEASD